MKNQLLIIVFLGFSSFIFGQNPIHILRYNDNFHRLKSDTVEKKGFDQLKMIPLGSNGVFLSMGGELREQVQHFDNQNFGDVPPVFKSVDATQLWHRAMLHADLELGKKWRVFTQLNQTERFFNPNPAIEIDANRLGLHQAFIEFRPIAPLSFRVGRQELGYGNNRLLTFREGPNNRLAFDAAIVQWKNKTWRIDALVASPVFQSGGVNDDLALKDLVTGVYATHTVVPKKWLMDIYALHFKGDRLRYNLIGGNESRQTLGTRLFSQLSKFNYELEATYQLGSFNQLTINAFSLSYDLKYRLTDLT
jgi:Alginate export